MESKTREFSYNQNSLKQKVNITTRLEKLLNEDSENETVSEDIDLSIDINSFFNHNK